MLITKMKTVIFILIFLLIVTISHLSSGENDPAALPAENEMTESPSERRYTDQEFANLSDAEKVNIYYNFPQQLPENFNPDVYMHIFHPENEDTEN